MESDSQDDSSDEDYWSEPDEPEASKIPQDVAAAQLFSTPSAFDDLEALAENVLNLFQELSNAYEPRQGTRAGRPRNPDREANRNHQGATTMAARAQADIAKLDAVAPVEGKRQRKKPDSFVAGSTQVRGSRQSKEPALGLLTQPLPPKRDSNKARAATRKAARDAFKAKLAEYSAATFVDFSWRQRRAFSICAYCEAIERGYPKMRAYEAGAIAGRVDERSVRRWVKDWLTNDGFLSPCNWGRNQKVPCFMEDEDIQLQSKMWWTNHGVMHSELACLLLLLPLLSLGLTFFSVGDPNARLIDFQHFLCGNPDRPGSQGILDDILDAAGKSQVCLETCRKYANSLGFFFQQLKRGTFSDKHEHSDNVDDRNTRFLPEYGGYWRREAINCFA